MLLLLLLFRIHILATRVHVFLGVCEGLSVWLLLDRCQCIDLVIAFGVCVCPCPLCQIDGCSLFRKKHLFRNKIELLFSFIMVSSISNLFLLPSKFNLFFSTLFSFCVRTFYLLFFFFLFSVALNWFVWMKNVYNQKSNWINSREPQNNTQRTPTTTRHQNSGLSCV